MPLRSISHHLSFQQFSRPIIAIISLIGLCGWTASVSANARPPSPVMHTITGHLISHPPYLPAISAPVMHTITGRLTQLTSTPEGVTLKVGHRTVTDPQLVLDGTDGMSGILLAVPLPSAMPLHALVRVTFQRNALAIYIRDYNHNPNLFGPTLTGPTLSVFRLTRRTPELIAITLLAS